MGVQYAQDKGESGDYGRTLVRSLTLVLYPKRIWSMFGRDMLFFCVICWRLH